MAESFYKREGDVLESMEAGRVLIEAMKNPPLLDDSELGMIIQATLDRTKEEDPETYNQMLNAIYSPRDHSIRY